ncbi:hypothetical protein RJ640_004828 [Escallonia rubra]|uniref:Cytochrome P450 n=1 Tax=Escallonia rubra TaxID=112253 RepID=A0AA88RAF4_9ASTE|nr:hypothetical protein RJ640_004828 [Escallonia rubra]
MPEMPKHPNIMRKAQDELSKRLFPPAPLLLPRECGERCDIKGYEIPIKAKVIIIAWAIGWNPKHCTHADGVRRNMEKLHQGLDDILESIINEHRAKALKGEGQACKDLVDVLLQYQDGKNDFSLTTDNIKAVILDIFGAGSETSATTIDWSMIEMLKNPSVMRKAQDEVRQVCTNKGDVDEADLDELEYLHLVIKETLRLHPPAPLLLPRECSERCEINGYEIPVKTKVIVNAWAIGRDPKIWADAESFKPERFLDSSIDYKGTRFEYIPFGSGWRICPGMSFGLTVVELLLAKLLYHFDWKLPSGMKQEELDMTERFGATVRRKDDLYMQPKSYSPNTIFLMELQLPSFSILFAFTLFVFVLLRTRNRSKAIGSAPNLPPGPWKLPFIGSMHHLAGSLPHRALRDLANKHGSLMHLQLGEVSTTHIIASNILCYDSTDIAFAPYGEYWRQLRKICALELLSNKRVESFRSLREAETSNLIGLIASECRTGSAINLTEKVYSHIFGTTSSAAFGKKIKSQEAFIALIKEVIKVAAGFNIADVYPSIKLLHLITGVKRKVEKLHQGLDMILEEIISEHREKATHKGQGQAYKDLVQDEVRRVCGNKGDVDETDLHELKYLHLVIKETLRLHPPAPLLLPRECSERCEINGYEIPVKTKVIVNAWAIGRDPKNWADAESFKPERFLDSSIDYKGTSFEYIPFGSGRRICPGTSFGLAIVELSLAKLLYHFDWKLPNGIKHEELDMTEAFAASVTRKEDLTAYEEVQTKSSASKLPPGPWQLPLIGNMHNLCSLPHHLLRDLAKKYGPLMYLRLGEVPTIVVSSPEIAKEVMKTHDLIFAQRPYLLASRIISYDSTNIGFAPYGDYWRQLRKICITELLSIKRVQTFRRIREDEVSSLIREISVNEKESLNLSKKIFSLTYGVTARAAFGKKCDDQDVFISLVEKIIEMAAGFCVADMYPSAKFLQVISGLRARLEKDIFTAGSETSSTTVEWAMSEMLKAPRVMERAQAEVRKVFGERRNVDETGLRELRYLQAVIKETLRLHPSAPLLLPRESREQCEINGYEIPVKSKVIINGWAINRDPRYWPQTERFYPERFLDSSIDYKGTDFEFIPFGAGRRICPGITFAIANIELPLAQLLNHFDWKLPNGHGVESRTLKLAPPAPNASPFWMRYESRRHAGRRICPGVSFGLAIVELSLANLLYQFDWKLPSGIEHEELDITEAFAVTDRRKEDMYVIPVAYQPLPHVKRSRAKSSASKLPPGPWQLPLIGNMHNLVGSLPHHLLRDLAKKYGPLMYLRLGEVPTIVVSSPEIAKEVMKTHDLIFAQRPYLLASRIISYDSTNIGFAPYGDYWRQLRKICITELLSIKRVQTFRRIREDEVSSLIKEISANEKESLNLSKKIFSLTYGVTARAAFGKKCDDQDVFVSLVEQIIEMAAGFCVADMYPSAKFLQVISGLRARLEKDMFSAGSETSSTAVEWAMSEMLKAPHVMERAQAEVRKVFGERRNVDETGLGELRYLQAVIKETLRLHPSAPLLLPRESREQCEINGYEIPAKTTVIVNGWAINRDPRYWPQAESFYPERFLDSSIDYGGTDFEFIPFGAGRRICPGITFAIANIELPLAQLLYHFDWKLPNEVPSPSREHAGEDNLLLVKFNLALGSVQLVKRFKAKNPTLRLPPGPLQLPLIGNMHNLVGSLPHHILRDLAKKYGPLTYLRLGEVPTVVVSSPEIAKEVMKTHDLIFAQRPYFLAARILSYDSTNIVFAPYGEYWRQLRKNCIMELLSAKRVKTFRAIREEEVSNVIQEILAKERTTINLSKKIFSLTYGITARAAFGEKGKDQELFLSLMEEIIELGSGFNIADMYPSVKWLEVISGLQPRFEKIHKKVDKILDNILNEHKNRTIMATGKGDANEDLVDVLIRYQKHGDLEFPLTDSNIKAVILDIFIAGSETSSTAMGWAMLEMLKNPSLMERAQVEDDKEVTSSKPILPRFGLEYVFELFKAKNPTLRLPPGPLQLPLIGNMHNLVGSLPHHILRDLAKKYGPLMYLRLGEVPTVVVSSPEIAKEVMKTHDLIFAQRPYFLAARILSYDSTNIVFAPYGKGDANEDLVDVLIRYQKHGDLEFPLTDSNIKAVILDIFIAGSETSSTAMGWAMLEMLKNPSLMERAQVEIPAKTKVIVNAWAISRDPRHWHDAERFYPERFLDSSVDYKGTNFEYIPFGAGRRICPGIAFALANIELPLAQLLYHFEWKLPNGLKHEGLDMTEAFGSTAGRKHELCLIPVAYHSSHVG